jgi:hypothetical protein
MATSTMPLFVLIILLSVSDYVFQYDTTNDARRVQVKK